MSLEAAAQAPSPARPRRRMKGAARAARIPGRALSRRLYCRWPMLLVAGMHHHPSSSGAPKIHTQVYTASQWRSSPQILGGAELRFRLNWSMDEYLLSKPPNRALPHRSKTSRLFLVLAAAGTSALPHFLGCAKQLPIHHRRHSFPPRNRYAMQPCSIRLTPTMACIFGHPKPEMGILACRWTRPI